MNTLKGAKMSQSPQVDKSAKMTFPEAVKAIIDGKKVTKLEWENEEVYLFLDNYLRIMKTDGTKHVLLVSEGDILGTDWVIVYHQ